MRDFLKSSFAGPFTIGFVLGALGLIVFQPASATHSVAHHIAAAVHVAL